MLRQSGLSLRPFRRDLSGCWFVTFTRTAGGRAAALAGSVVATFLLNLRELGRRPDAKERPAHPVVCPLMVTVLCLWRHERDEPNWSIHSFVMALARLGGHQNRKHDGHPGWLTLWRGWQALQAMLLGYRVRSRRLQCGEN
jgi:hypothetical protein